MTPTQQMIVTVLSTSAVTGGVIEVIRLVAQWVNKRHDKGFAKLEREVGEINQIVNALKESFSDMGETNRVILHDRIWGIYRKLQNDQDISIEDKSNLDYMFKEYKKLKGNHKAEIMYNEINKKPVRKETDK